jgi:hypothetical protein
MRRRREISVAPVQQDVDRRARLQRRRGLTPLAGTIR